MKLGRASTFLAFLSTVAFGCGGTPAKPADVPAATSTTQLSAAELAPAEAPRVGKPQAHVEPTAEPLTAEPTSDDRPKPEPRKDADRRPNGGGFSGYK